MRQIFLILIAMQSIVQAQAPEWLATDLYPFENKYIQLQAGEMHYVDEGEGEVILFIHGTPTWSFLYRDFIKELSKNYRCIAIDHIGFGLSEKPVNFNGTPEDHSNNLGEFINKLGLTNITLVVHDFGGPIGLSWASKHPNNVKKIVMFNTWLWETASNPEVVKIDKTINSWVGRFLYLNINFSPKVLLKKGFSDKSALSKEVHRSYIKPFPDKDSRMGPYHLAQALMGSSDWYQQQWESLVNIEDKPWLILWGTADDFIKPESLDRWKERIPNAEVKTFECGHFVQEEATGPSIQALRNFIAE